MVYEDIDYQFIFNLGTAIIISSIITYKTYIYGTKYGLIENNSLKKTHHRKYNSWLAIRTAKVIQQPKTTKRLKYTMPSKVVTSDSIRDSCRNPIYPDEDTLTVSIDPHRSSDTFKNGSNSYDIKNDYQLDTIIKSCKELSQDEIRQLENNYILNLSVSNNSPSKITSSSGDIGLKENSVIFMICQNNNIVVQLILLQLDEQDIFHLFSKFNNLGLDMDSVILYNIVIKEEYQNRGYDNQLLKLVEDWCIKNNKYHICVFVPRDNLTITNFYLNRSYALMPFYTVDNEIMMKKSLRTC